jgi:6-pyruvoyltetrahydropterin/6-carboxytetrahydropterin synthase
MTFKSTKTYGSNLGLSAAFRQWKAKSHCRLIHGYSLGFRFVFQASHLDENNWVVDFGSLKPLKQKLEELYDHRLIVAEDDPQAPELGRLEAFGLADVRTAVAVGCEAFALEAFKAAMEIVNNKRVRVISCECFEHGANSAIYEQPFPPHLLTPI